MLGLGSFRSRTCQHIGRRAFLTAGAVAPFAMTHFGAEASEPSPARSVILLWLWGGPSHLDTFDPKPHAPVEYRGIFSTIATRTPGLRFTELFPRLAARSDLFTVIRSHVNLHDAHGPAGSIGLTGTTGVSDIHGPNFGSVVSRVRHGDLPTFISVGRGQLRDANELMRGYGGGTWGAAYDPFRVSCSDTGNVAIPSLELLDGLSPLRLADRRAVRNALDSSQRRAEASMSAQWQGARRQAYRLLTSAEGRRAFDVSREPQQTRSAYGQTAFGQSCLLARRLVEARVPYVQVNWSEYVEIVLGGRTDYGWDTHQYNFEYLADRHGPILDRAFSALLDDLRARGLLESTLVVCIGEFGRTPRINGKMARDHWPRCYSSIWAGAGVRGGAFVGESDARGEDPRTPPITPDMVGATILKVAGINTEMRAELRVLPEARVIDELF